MPQGFPEDIIAQFEFNHHGRGIARTGQKIISNHEYFAARNYLAHKPETSVNIAFAGGCFPVQHNIVFEDLFHRSLSCKIENEFSCEVNFTIIRYERFLMLPEKIETLAQQRKPDILILSIRPEPFLRLVKLYYKYIDDSGRLRKSLNLPRLNMLAPEKFDMYTLSRRFHFGPVRKRSAFYRFLISANYLCGMLAGNRHYALRKYGELVVRLIDICNKNKIELILLGPNIRSNAWLEPGLSGKLDSYMRHHFADKNYLDGKHESKNYHQSMTMENGIHVTPAYHQLTAEKLFNFICSKRLLQSAVKPKQQQESVPAKYPETVFVFTQLTAFKNPIVQIIFIHLLKVNLQKLQAEACFRS